jgi:hypothetical protein
MTYFIAHHQLHIVYISICRPELDLSQYERSMSAAQAATATLIHA